jgi:acyl dehydratase
VLSARLSDVTTPAEHLGRRVGPADFVIDGDRVAAFAAAIGDEHPAHRSGALAPPTYVVVPTFGLVVQALDQAVGLERMGGGVHGEEDIWVHRPLAAGSRVRARAALHGVRVSGAGTRVAIRVWAVADGDLAVEHYWTTFVRGVSLGQQAGPDTPGHEISDRDRDGDSRRVVVPIPDDITWRYADASGDHSPFHTDPAAAAAAGFPAIILHGMCTLGLAVAALRPDSRRVAARFARPAHPGHVLILDAYDAGFGYLAFEASSQSVPVLSNGRLE